MSAANTQETKYFDLHTTGIGYLNRVRMVQPTKGPAYRACSISALRGNANGVEYTPFDLSVTGSAAKEVIADLEQDANARDAKVLVSFRIGDAMPVAFTYSQGERTGQTGVSIRGRLIKVLWAKVNGELVYEAPKAELAQEASEPRHDEAAPAEAAPAAQDEHRTERAPRQSREPQDEARTGNGVRTRRQAPRTTQTGRRASAQP
ncbi:DUF3577 domain-containing protein [Ralstonia sp. 1138]|uniref:DUF3577 domain-containing protein n=1 Tax=Ralstonia sp. 1138 TaxID=3156423 RepID=UPI003398630B